MNGHYYEPHPQAYTEAGARTNTDVLDARFALDKRLASRKPAGAQGHPIQSRRAAVQEEKMYGSAKPVAVSCATCTQTMVANGPNTCDMFCHTCNKQTLSEGMPDMIK